MTYIDFIYYAIYIIYPLIGFACFLGIVFLVRSSWELEREKKALELAQNELSHIFHYNDVPVDGQYDSEIISQWMKICKSRVSSGLSTAEGMLEDILLDISGRRDNATRFVMTSLIILGLLGTFLGMTVALLKASDIVTMMVKAEESSTTAYPELAQKSQKSTELAPESAEKQFEKLLTKLKPVLSGMKVAFLTSVMGLVSSLGLGVAFAKYSGKRNDFRRAAMSFAYEKLLPIFTPEKDLSLGQAISKYNDNMEKSLQRIEDTSKATLEESFKKVEYNLALFCRDVAKQLGKFAEKNTELWNEHTSRVSNQNELLVKKVADAAQENTQSIDKFVSKVSSQNEQLIGKITNATKELISASLSTLQGEIKSLYQRMVEERGQIDSKLQRFLDEATQASASVSAENRKLTEQMREQLAEDLGGITDNLSTLSVGFGNINDTLREHLSGLINRLDMFDVPVERAAENIEGSQENFVKFMSRTVGDMQREYQRQIENNAQQLEVLAQANQRVATFLAQLDESSKNQRDGIHVLNQNLSSLVENVASLISNIRSLSSDSSAVSQAVNSMSQHVRMLEVSIQSFVERSSNISQGLSSLSSLDRSISAIAQCARTLGEAANNLAEQVARQRGRWRFPFFGRRS